MAERAGPAVYSIAAHRGFADALVAGLLPRYRDPDLGLARLTLLLPSQRAARTVREAFIRLFGEQGLGGLLMPRMVVAGDLDLDESLGPLLDPIGQGTLVPPVADPTRRWLRVAEIITEQDPGNAPHGAALLRLARETCQTMDRLLVEEIAPETLLGEKVLGIVGDQADHWREATRQFLLVQDAWLKELAARGEVDGATRRNLLFERIAAVWKASPPPTPIVAAGVTSAAPALARLLRVVAELPGSSVILPDLDLGLAGDTETWAELGRAGAPGDPDGEPFGAHDAVTHPQYHLKLLLNRMGIAPGEVRPWHRAGIAAAPPARSHAISSLFLPPQASARWVDLPADRRRLSGVRLMESATPEEEAQAIALLAREALEEPERRVAIVTPDRALAARVAAHLRRWHIEADDSAGRALSQTPAGRVFLLLADVMAQHAAPVPLLALLGHPMAGAGHDRAQWLDHVRALDLRLRGPRPPAGLAALQPVIALMAKRDEGAAHWWEHVTAILAPVMALGEQDRVPLAAMMEALGTAAEALCGDAVWAREDGRALARMIEDIQTRAADVGTTLAPAELPGVLRDVADAIAVRPAYGGHPRVAIYGLLESRMNRADLVICGGLSEGTWPQKPAADPVLPPAVLRALGVPGADFRIGLSAHDLAGAMGAPQVVLSRSARDSDGPAVPSRFLLRVQALLGAELIGQHSAQEYVALARAIDHADAAPHYPRPQPCPTAEQRRVEISATALDRLRSDPYQFYAQAILRLRSLDPLDDEPSARWKGEVAHKILERWHERGGSLRATALGVLEEENAHPMMRHLWMPRLLAALEWVEIEMGERGRGKPVGVEAKGEWKHRGILIHGRADRIDAMEGGALAIVDYKTGSPPSGREVESGYALQLGTLGLIAANGGFSGISGTPTSFEYWSLGASKKSVTGFGYVSEPIKEGQKKTGIPREEFLTKSLEYLDEALDRWIVGSEPFTARLNPDAAGYADYDQLMRLDEWMSRESEDRKEGKA